MCASACAASWSLIWVSSFLICSVRVVSTAMSAWVLPASTSASGPVRPRGASVRRACSVAGWVRPL